MHRKKGAGREKGTEGVMTDPECLEGHQSHLIHPVHFTEGQVVAQREMGTPPRLFRKSDLPHSMGEPWLWLQLQ